MSLFENEIYKKIKENISMMVLIPALLGGIWQVVELSYISTSYIRFFSVSQLVPDGILILFLLISFYIGIKIAIFGLRDNKTEEKLNPEQNSRSKMQTIFLSIALMIFPGYFIYLAYLIFSDQFNEIHFFSLQFIVIPGTIICIVLFIKAIFLLIKALFPNTSFGENRNFEKISIFLTGPISIAVILVLYFSLSYFHKNFILPTNLKNIDYIKCKLKKNNGSISEPEVLYLNDKYIFIEFKIKNEKKIEVLSFESLLESNSCWPL